MLVAASHRPGWVARPATVAATVAHAAVGGRRQAAADTTRPTPCQHPCSSALMGLAVLLLLLAVAPKEEFKPKSNSKAVMNAPKGGKVRWGRESRACFDQPAVSKDARQGQGRIETQGSSCLRSYPVPGWRRGQSAWQVHSPPAMPCTHAPCCLPAVPRFCRPRRRSRPRQRPRSSRRRGSRLPTSPRSDRTKLDVSQDAVSLNNTNQQRAHALVNVVPVICYKSVEGDTA